MLEAGSDFVSGNDLAALLEISRVSVWSHLEKLKDDGFEFEALRNKGYRLKKTPSFIHPDLLNAYLWNNNTSLPVIYLEEIDSTNSETERQLANNHSTPFAVITGKQSKGRGRHGRVWYAEDRGNAYISLGFKPNFSPDLIRSFTPWIATELCHNLVLKYHIPLKIKWPNDLMIYGKKVCGMLAESRIDMDGIRDIVLGVGINISGNPETWPEELQQKATSLEAACKCSFNINEMVAYILSIMLNAYNQFINNTWRIAFEKNWPHYDILYNKEVNGFHGRMPVEGIAKGITEEGSLRLLLKNGKIELLDAGELSLSEPINNKLKIEHNV